MDQIVGTEATDDRIACRLKDRRCRRITFGKAERVSAADVANHMHSSQRAAAEEEPLVAVGRNGLQSPQFTVDAADRHQQHPAFDPQAMRLNLFPREIGVFFCRRHLAGCAPSRLRLRGDAILFCLQFGVGPSLLLLGLPPILSHFLRREIMA